MKRKPLSIVIVIVAAALAGTPAEGVSCSAYVEHAQSWFPNDWFYSQRTAEVCYGGVGTCCGGLTGDPMEQVPDDVCRPCCITQTRQCESGPNDNWGGHTILSDYGTPSVAECWRRTNLIDPCWYGGGGGDPAFQHCFTEPICPTASTDPLKSSTIVTAGKGDFAGLCLLSSEDGGFIATAPPERKGTKSTVENPDQIVIRMRQYFGDRIWTVHSRRSPPAGPDHVVDFLRRPGALYVIELLDGSAVGLQARIFRRGDASVGQYLSQYRDLYIETRSLPPAAPVHPSLLLVRIWTGSAWTRDAQSVRDFLGGGFPGL